MLGSVVVRSRLGKSEYFEDQKTISVEDFEQVFKDRIKEADEFYEVRIYLLLLLRNKN